MGERGVRKRERKKGRGKGRKKERRKKSKKKWKQQKGKQQKGKQQKQAKHLRRVVATGRRAVDTRARTWDGSGRRAGSAREARISGNVDGLARADATVCVRAKG